MSGYLVGSAAFKAVETGDPRLAGSIPVHLRHHVFWGSPKATEIALNRTYVHRRSQTYTGVPGSLLSALLSNLVL